MIPTSDIEASTSIIDRSILRYLFDRRKNRLSTPHSKSILHLENLEAWHLENDFQKLQERNSYLLGNYDLFYLKHAPYKKTKTFHVELTIDSLAIEQTIESDLHAKYSHDFDGKPCEWEGQVHSNAASKTAYMLLHGPVIEHKTFQIRHVPNDKPVFIILNLPVSERTFDVLVGTATGSSDDDKVAISVLTVVVRRGSQLNLHPEYHDKIRKFFQAYLLQTWIKAPELTEVSQYDHLVKSLQEGLDRIKAMKANTPDDAKKPVNLKND